MELAKITERQRLMETRLKMKRTEQCRKILIKPQNLTLFKEIEENKQLALKHRMTVVTEVKSNI